MADRTRLFVPDLELEWCHHCSGVNFCVSGGAQGTESDESQRKNIFRIVFIQGAASWFHIVQGGSGRTKTNFLAFLFKAEAP